MVNVFQWQKINGSCPLVVEAGIHGSGKTSAGKVALACTGGYRKRFLTNFTNKVSKDQYNNVNLVNNLNILFCTIIIVHDESSRDYGGVRIVNYFFNHLTS